MASALAMSSPQALMKDGRVAIVAWIVIETLKMTFTTSLNTTLATGKSTPVKAVFNNGVMGFA